MDTRDLEVFRAVAETGSLSRAAARLAIAQPAVSRRVAALEAELGVPLLVRGGRGAAPTEAGRRLAAHAVRVLDALREAREEVAAMGRAAGGAVTFGLPPSAAELLAPVLAARLAARFPGVLLHLREAFGGDLEAWLVEGSLDAALIYNPGRSDALDVEVLLIEALVLVGPPGDPLLEAPVPFARLFDVPLVLPGGAHNLRRTVEAAARADGQRLTPAVEADGLGALRELVRSGAGRTVLSPAAVARETAAGTLAAAPLVDPAVTQTVALATAAHRPLPLAARALLEIARREVRALATNGRWAGRLP